MIVRLIEGTSDQQSGIRRRVCEETVHFVSFWGRDVAFGDWIKAATFGAEYASWEASRILFHLRIFWAEARGCLLKDTIFSMPRVTQIEAPVILLLK